MNIYPVILCGGSGTRLWPASRTRRPKQFTPLLGRLSLFQNTVLRLQAIEGAQPPVVVAGRGHVEAVRDQLAGIGVEGVIIAEPTGRDSAPAIAVAAAWIAARDPNGVAVVVASDHHIPDAGAFAAAAVTAAKAAAQGYVVTFGVRPTYPATAYGYVRPGAVLDGAVSKVERFVEKPRAEAAQALVDEGALWNSGNFVFAAQALMDELALHAPEVGQAVRDALADAETDGDAILLGEPFLTAPKISFDYAVMEKTARAAVIPVAFDWSDVGAWEAVWEASEKDADGNAVSGDAVLVDSRDCLVRAEGGPLVAIVGLKGVGVIAEPDAVLVCDLASSQGIKQVVEQLAAAGRSEALAGRREPSLGDLATGMEQWLFTAALPLWWSLGADHEKGGFHELMGQDGRPVEAPRRLRVQTRQLFTYATAGAMGWTGPWRQAAEHGLDAILTRYRRPDGLFRFSVDADGESVEERAMLYEQAFVLLSLAAASKALPQRTTLAESAEELALRLVSWARHGGGFREAKPDAPFQSNALMHLFEAALAWVEADDGELWGDLADDLAELALTKFIDPASGGLREVFDADWAPAAGADGRMLWPGHQFEWAWLLDQWGALRGRDEARTAVARLYAVGKAGVDPVRGVAIDAVEADFSPLSSGARLWPQTERIRAAVMQGDAREARAGVAGLNRYLDVPVRGLWRDKLLPDGSFVDEPAPASSLYHIVGAVRALQGLK